MEFKIARTTVLMLPTVTSWTQTMMDEEMSVTRIRIMMEL
jgi:hypothetical protein